MKTVRLFLSGMAALSAFGLLAAFLFAAQAASAAVSLDLAAAPNNLAKATLQGWAATPSGWAASPLVPPHRPAASGPAAWQAAAPPPSGPRWAFRPEVLPPTPGVRPPTASQGYAPGLTIEVNYSHDWVVARAAPDTPVVITITQPSGFVATIAGITDGTGYYQSGDHWYDWVPYAPNISPGDRAEAGITGTTTSVDPVGLIRGAVDDAENIISGTLEVSSTYPTVTVFCQVWVENGPPEIQVDDVPTDGGAFLCDFDAEGWDIQPGQMLAVRYVEPAPDADMVIGIFEVPWMRVNMGHDWVGGNYPLDHSFWITVTDGGGEVKATAQIDSRQDGGWGTDGFETQPQHWSPAHPDIAAGDVVYFTSDDGYTNVITAGVISVELDTAADLVQGTVTAAWFSDTLAGRCSIWAPGGIDINFAVDPNGGAFACNYAGQYDLLPGHDMAVMYMEPDNDTVIDVFREPAPYLDIHTWGNNVPTTGGNYAFTVEYQNHGDGPADGVSISATLLGGMTYLTDTTGLPHTGSGLPGDPLVWQVGSLPPFWYSSRFDLFVSVQAGLSETITDVVQIQTTTPYFQWETENMVNWYSALVEANDTHLSVDKYPWTWDPAPGQPFVYQVNVCNNGRTGSSELTLTDTLPLSTTLLDWWGQDPAWTEVSSSAHELVLAYPSVSGGWWCTQAYLSVTLDAQAWIGMPLTNTAQVTASNDMEAEDNTYVAGHYVGAAHANLELWKDWSWGTWVPGGDLYYEFSYHNVGNLPATDVIITNTLPASTTFVEAWQDGGNPITPSLATDEIVVWDIGALQNGFSGRITIHLRADEAALPGAVLTHTAEIIRLPAEDLYSDNTITWVDALQDFGPNLRVEKYGYWSGEGELNYEIRVFNLGSTRLENIWITDTYPVSTTWVDWWWVNHGSWVTATHNLTDRQAIFWVESLDPGGTASLGFNIPLEPGAIGVRGLSFTNTVDAPYPGDVNPADNQAVDVRFAGADLQMEKTLEDGIPLPGEVVTFALQFSNPSWWWSEGSVQISDTLPEGLEFVSSRLYWCGAQINCDYAPGFMDSDTLTWTWNADQPVGSWWWNRILLAVRITDTATGLDSFTNWAEIASTLSPPEPEPDYLNNLDSATVDIALPYFTVSKSYAGNAVAGMPVTYTLTVENLGHIEGTGIHLADELPAGLTYGGGDGSLSGGTITWTLPSLDPHIGLGTGWFWGTLACTADATVSNDNYAVTGSDQGITSSLGAPVSFTILAPDIQPSFTASSLSVPANTPVTFTSTSVTNGGPLTITWNFGDASTGSGDQVSHAFAQEGVYTVTLTATDGCGYSESTTLQVEVYMLRTYLPVINR